jgi:hypothetical protein
MPNEKKKTEKKEEKKPLDMTTEEAMNYLFPKKAVEHLKQVARGNDDKNGKPDASQDGV